MLSCHAILCLTGSSCAQFPRSVHHSVHCQDEGFQDDLFPDDIAGVPALDANSWLDGKNHAPILTSMDPEHMAAAAATAAKTGASAAVFKPKGPKSLAELKRWAVMCEGVFRTLVFYAVEFMEVRTPA